ncbi:MAG TPA: aminoglycoside phosphotransferase family protein [Candidatus Saccharimonadales bacterium]|nr:aminoglycoside phosphotransferase family protein [Candidatus Saccharimonadales bacterium]
MSDPNLPQHRSQEASEQAPGEHNEEVLNALGQTILMHPDGIELSVQIGSHVEIINRSRRGRLNDTHILDDRVRKYGRIIESERPYRLLNESWGLQVAQQRGLHVPEVYSYTRDTDGHETIDMELIRGTPLDRLTDKQIRAASLQQVGLQLAKLDNISEGFGWINPHSRVGTYQSWGSYLQDYAATYTGVLTEAKLIEQSEADKLLSQTSNANLGLVRPSLVHRDIKWGNLILAETQDVFIIDWENVILGDSLYDLAIFGVREGHNEPWRKMAQGLDADINSKKYALYEAIALVGIVEYHKKYETNATEKAAQLKDLIGLL